MIWGIIPCSKEKIWDIAPEKKAVRADEAYRSAFHRYARAYVCKHCEDYLILSAKYGFMRPDFMIETSYDVTFSRSLDPTISSHQLRKQALTYPHVTKLIVVCPQLYALRVQEAFAEHAIDIVYPLQSVGGFGAMHTWLKKHI